jgi:hypothetical protein
VDDWECVCGRRHAAWWRSTPPPSCPHGWPMPPERPPLLPQLVIDLFNTMGGPLPWPDKEQPGA